MRILLVDDDADDRALVLREARAVAPEAGIVEIDRAERLDRALAAGGIDLAVVDYALRWGNGIEVVRRIRAAEARVAIIMFTGSGNEEVAVEAMKAGLDDYVVKGAQRLPRLRAALRAALARSHERAALAAAEEDLRRSLAQQRLLLRELHHRVKNNLQLVVSLIRLRATREQDERLRRVLSDMAERVHSLARVQDRIYATDDLSRVDFRGYLDAVVHSLASMQGGGQVSVRLEDMDRLDLPVERAVPLGLMCYELLLNAVRHAFPQRPEGEVAVRVRDRAGGREITIEDDGVGFDPQHVPAREMLGWTLVRELAVEAEVEIRVEPRESGGTRVCILLHGPEPDGGKAAGG